MNRTLILSASALALVAGAAQAQDAGTGVTVLEAISVTANRTPTEKGKVGSKVEQVTRQEIEEKSFATVADYLTRLPGVSISSNGGIGNTKRIFIRGAPGKYIKTLHNGIDISDPANTQVQAHFEHLLVGGVTGIEVLKGSQSTLYGSSAIAGLVDVTTLGDVEDGIGHTVELEGGSFGTVRGRYGLAGASDGSRIAANVAGLRTDGISSADGFPERDGYDNLTLDLAVEHRINEAFSVFGALLYVDAKADYDDDGADNLVNRGASRMRAGRVGFNLDLMDGRLKNTVSVQGLKIDREDTTEFFGAISTARYVGERSKVDWQGSFEVSDAVLLQYGADHERQRADVVAWSPVNGRYDLTGLWAQAVVSPVDNLVVTAGLRHDEHSTFGGHTTYRGTASYGLDGTGTRFHASAGTGFRAPSLAELYEFPSGNPALTPETSRSFDFGIEQRFAGGRLVADLTYFRLDIDDQIVSQWPLPYIQVPGTTRSQGVEASFTYAAADWLDLAGSYTYTDSRTETGARNFYVPRHAFVLSASARPAERWTVSADLKYVADTDGVAFPPPTFAQTRVVMDDYLLLNAKVAYQVTDAAEIYLRGENLLDQDYQVIPGYGTPGIAAYAGFKARF